MKLRDFILCTVAIVLGIVIVSVISVMLAGLFDPRVDNKAIFAIIGPAFQTVIGVFVGIMARDLMEKGQ